MTKTIQAVRFADGETYKYDIIWNSALADGHAVLLKGKEAEEALATYHRKELLELIKPGDTLTAVCTSYSRQSGSAKYKVFVPAFDRDGRIYIRNITRMASNLVGFKLSKDDEIVMGGWGFSKSFQIGYSLGCALWPNGTPEPHGTRNGKPDSDGGYALSVNAH